MLPVLLKSNSYSPFTSAADCRENNGEGGGNVRSHILFFLECENIQEDFLPHFLFRV